MRTRTIAAALAAAALLTLTACEGTGTTTGSSTPSTTVRDTTVQDIDDQPKDADTAPTDTPDGTARTEPDTAALPDLVGQDLQTAQDEAQAAGFYVLDDQDASGQGRLQIMDRNWTVCGQDPEAGTHPTDTLVTLYAVKDDETC